MTQFIKPTKGLVTSFFSKNRKHPVLQGVIRPHQGVDFGTHGTDDEILAAAAGTVRVHGYHQSAGNYISINHHNGWTTGYLHLKKVSVKNGQKVKQGQVIGIKGNTGIGTGVHLHFELHRSNGWTNDLSKKVDPLLYITDPTTKEWQHWLKELGFYKGAIDGIYGNGTITAVTSFQQKNGLTVDGVCGRTTYGVIKKKYELLKKEEKVVKENKPKEKEVDSLTNYMNQKLPLTQQKDAADLFEKAFQDDYFSVNHALKVKTMTRAQYYDLKESLQIREKLNKKVKKDK